MTRVKATARTCLRPSLSRSTARLLSLCLVFWFLTTSFRRGATLRGLGKCSSATEIRKVGASFKEGLSSNSPACPLAAKVSFHVLIPFHEVDPSAAVKSVISQDYDKEYIHIWLVEDVNDDAKISEQSLCDHVIPLEIAVQAKYVPSRTSNLRCYRTSQHLGPAATRFLTLKLLHSESVTSP